MNPAEAATTTISLGFERERQPAFNPSAVALSGGTVFANRFLVADRVGQGGFGTVYRARDQLLDREVAIKVLNLDRHDEAVVRRFVREASFARDVASEHVVRIFDAGSHDGIPYLVLEYLEGATLRERLAAGPLPVEEVTGLAAQVLEGLAALHEKGIVHRDIKPSNVLFDDRGIAKVGDFGLAVVPADGERSLALGVGELVGSPAYLSPEQVLGQTVSPASDLYSLGVVLFEALAGQRPFRGEGLLDLALARIARSAPSVRALRPDCPRWLDLLVGRLLECQPSRRYQTARAVAADLERRRVARRFLRLRWLSLAAVVVVAAGGVFATWKGTRFDHIESVSDELGRGVRAIDSSGRTLWERRGPEAIDPRLMTYARLGAGERRLVTVQGEPDRPLVGARLEFVVLDPQSGELERTVRVPGVVQLQVPSHALRSLPERYRINGLHAIDLNGDQLDEVLVGLAHATEWSWYSVLWEPELDRFRELVSSAGHLGLQAVHDLDGDGTAELLFSGFNSVLGRYPTVLAYQIGVGIGEQPQASGVGQLGAGATPGLGYFLQEPLSRMGSRVLWTRLLPRGGILYEPNGADQIVVDPLNRRLEARYRDRAPAVVTFEGEDVGVEGSTQLQRGRAWTLIEEAQRFLRVHENDAAGGAARSARLLARDIEDAVLAECAGRLEGTALVAGGRVEEAEALFSELAEDLEAASEVAFSAASAYHVAGDLDRAVSWYRRGLGQGGHARSGSRQRIYFVEGIVLALAELGQLERAAREAVQWGEANADPVRTRALADLVRIADGRAPSREPLAINPWDIDTVRYAAFLRQLEGEGPSAELLQAAHTHAGETFDARGAFLVLAAEILADQGDAGASTRLRQQGFDDLEARARESPVARGLLVLARGRAARRDAPSMP